MLDLALLRDETMQFWGGVCYEHRCVRWTKTSVAPSLVCASQPVKHWSIVMEVAGRLPTTRVGGDSCHEDHYQDYICSIHSCTSYTNLCRNVNVLLKHMENNSGVLVAMSGRLRTHLDFAACLMTGSYLVTVFLPVSRRLVVMRLDWSSSFSSWINVAFRHCEVRISQRSRVEGGWRIINTWLGVVTATVFFSFVLSEQERLPQLPFSTKLKRI